MYCSLLPYLHNKNKRGEDLLYIDTYGFVYLYLCLVRWRKQCFVLQGLSRGACIVFAVFWRSVLGDGFKTLLFLNSFPEVKHRQKSMLSLEGDLSLQ